jgi:hypothetical protein
MNPASRLLARPPDPLGPSPAWISAAYLGWASTVGTWREGRPRPVVFLGGVGRHVVMIVDREPEPAQVGRKGVGAGVPARRGLGCVPARAIASLAVVRRGRGGRADQSLREGRGHPGWSARAARQAAGPWPMPVVPAAAYTRRKSRGGFRGRRARVRLLLGGCGDTTRLFKSRLEEPRRCRVVAVPRCSSCHGVVKIIAASIVWSVGRIWPAQQLALPQAHRPALRFIAAMLDGDEPGRKAGGTVAARLAKTGRYIFRTQLCGSADEPRLAKGRKPSVSRAGASSQT